VLLVGFIEKKVFSEFVEFPLSVPLRKCCTNHLHLNTAVIRRKSGGSLGTLKKSSAASNVERKMHREAFRYLFSFQRFNHVTTIAELPSHYSLRFGRPKFISWYEETVRSSIKLGLALLHTRLFTGNNFL